MGTIQYMSPEQAMGAKQVDARSDQYALALILYECVTGRQAHQGENALAVLRQIGDGGITPPRVHVPTLPAAFEEVLLRALSVDPRQRFPTMDAFGRALLRFAGSRARSISQALFQREGTPTGALGIAPTAVRPVTEADSAMPLTTPLAQITPVTPVSTTLSNSAAEIATANTRRGPRRTVLAVAGLVVVAGVVVGLMQRHKGGDPPPPARSPELVVETPPPAAPAPAPAPPPRTFRVAVQATPAEATFELDGTPAGTGRLERELPADGQPHTLRVTASGFAPRTVTFVDTPPPEALALERLPPETRRAPSTRRSSSTEQRPAAPAANAPAVGANQAPILKE
jgi:hypothetical protein